MTKRMSVEGLCQTDENCTLNRVVYLMYTDWTTIGSSCGLACASVAKFPGNCLCIQFSYTIPNIHFEVL